MTSMQTHPRILISLAFALLGGAAQAQEAIDMKLVQAGFVMRSIDTPALMERARHLPHRRIASRMKDGQPFYIYADVEYCKCVLVGNQQALQAYRDMALPPVPLPGDMAPRGVNPENLVMFDANGLYGIDDLLR